MTVQFKEIFQMMLGIALLLFSTFAFAQDWPDGEQRNALDRDARDATHLFLRNLCGNSVEAVNTEHHTYNPSAPRQVDLTREVPSNFYDAFGHCYYACEGSRRFGPELTGTAGTFREIGREIEDMFGGDEHDSFSQDRANQSIGIDVHTRAGSCLDLCQNAAFYGPTGADTLDLSAPERVCYSCAMRSLGNACSNQGEARTGRSVGDPHITTYDGARYSFQTVGEFILTRSDDRRFEIQTRQSPVNSSLSLNSGIAMNVDGDNVSIYLHEHPDRDAKTPLRINSVPTSMTKKKISLPSGGAVHVSEQRVVVLWPKGERAAIRIYDRGKFQYLDVSVQVATSRSGGYKGLLGNANRDSADDLRLANGAILQRGNSYGNLSRWVGSSKAARVLEVADKEYLKKLTRDFGDGWRVVASESLFVYAPGRSTASYTDRNFPEHYRSLGDLSTEQIQAAQKSCRAEGVQNADLEQCVFDVAFSNYSGFARSAAQAAQLVSLLEDLGVPNPIKPYMPNRIEKTVEGKLKTKVNKEKKKIFDKILR